VRKALMMTAAVLAAVFLWLVATLPPLPAATTGPPQASFPQPRTVAGAFHVHSTRSDGIGDRDTIAAAAARAGLRFVAMTDHGDATRTPDPPVYIHGVLCLDGVEISTNGGHYAVLDMPAAPYPLGGEASAVAEDVRRLGGFGVAAHPDSAKPLLRWTDWSVPIDGIEWLNLDSEWRDETNQRLARAAFDYLVRKGPALASVLDRPVETLEHWTTLTRRAPVVGVAGHDAHGGWSQRQEDGGRRGVPGVPSYEASFRTFAIRAMVDEDLSGSAERDARLVLRALRSGRVFTAIDAIAGPAWAEFRASNTTGTAEMGQTLLLTADTQLLFRSTLPPGGATRLLRDGQVATEVSSSELRVAITEPGAYRVEVRSPRAPGVPPVPWLVTNPIYVFSGPPVVPPPEVVVTPIVEIVDPGRIEKDEGSTATLESDGRRWRLAYRLRADERGSQYAALAIPLASGGPEFSAVTFTGSAPRPMRVSVQVRFTTEGGARWGHSVYLGPEPRTITIPLDRLVPIGTSAPRPPTSAVMSLLFVVDLVNARPGAEGAFDVSRVALGRRP
jgi:hypothetical protein